MDGNLQTDDQALCMEFLLNWCGMKYTELADAIDLQSKTVGRIADVAISPN